MGFIETRDPTNIRRALAMLHTEIAADEYLRDIPSINKTHAAFHAKDDAPEVRQSVFKCLRGLDFKAQFIVARKIERVFRDSFHANESMFYDYLISLLFENILYRYTRNLIYFAQRGSRKRQAQLAGDYPQGLKWSNSAPCSKLVSVQTNPIASGAE